MAEPFTPMHTHRTPDVALWDQYRALREQWMHEDNLVHHRMSWLLISEGLLLTAYNTMGAPAANWLHLGFPYFGIALAALIGVGIFTALAATDEIRRQYEEAGLADLCSLAPATHVAHRGRWAAKAVPFVFAALWLLALASSLRVHWGAS
jgi:hypothetical protein